MSRTARLWKGAGPIALSGLLLSGALAWGDDPSADLSRQLTELGRQAQEQGQNADASQFLRKALELDPSNQEAQSTLKLVALRQVDSIIGGQPGSNPIDSPNLQPPPPGFNVPPAPPAQPVPAPGFDAVPAPAPLPDDGGQPLSGIDRQLQLERVLEQQLTADIRSRIERARELVRLEQPDAALDTLRLALTAIDASDQVNAQVARNLRRQVEVEYRSTLQRQEEIEQLVAQRLRLAAAAQQETRALERLLTTQQTISSLMTQFNALIDEGVYLILDRRGTGDIVVNSQPFFDARVLAQSANALDPTATAPRAGLFVSSSIGFLTQTKAYEELKEFRYMATMLDVDRASVPFPDTITIEYPPADLFREISEKRIARYESVDLVERSDQTLRILSKLEQPVTMPFENETPLEDVLDYIGKVTADENMPTGIPIYVDPVGLLEAERTMQSPVTINLDGVPLKTTLKLLLNQLELTYTVKDGLMTITSADSSDTPTEIRVYPVADLSIIPISLFGGGGGGGMGGMGGGMGGMGGGMGGMGGGMGGMGGGMGGMGGGMGGMGGGMGGGMFSVPPSPQLEGQTTSPYLEKKSS